MEDILAVYEKPLSEREPVVCLDEKPVVLHADLRPPLALRPGRALRRDSEYERRGTANLFCGCSPRPAVILPRQRQTARCPSSPIICWTSPDTTQERIRSIW